MIWRIGKKQMVKGVYHRQFVYQIKDNMLIYFIIIPSSFSPLLIYNNKWCMHYAGTKIVSASDNNKC